MKILEFTGPAQKIDLDPSALNWKNLALIREKSAKNFIFQFFQLVLALNGSFYTDFSIY